LLGISSSCPVHSLGSHTKQLWGLNLQAHVMITFSLWTFFHSGRGCWESEKVFRPQELGLRVRLREKLWLPNIKT
jgi:hypothetical protein